MNYSLVENTDIIKRIHEMNEITAKIPKREIKLFISRSKQLSCSTSSARIGSFVGPALVNEFIVESELHQYYLI